LKQFFENRPASDSPDSTDNPADEPKSE
jgi:hypothetical protein